MIPISKKSKKSKDKSEFGGTKVPILNSNELNFLKEKYKGRL